MIGKERPALNNMSIKNRVYNLLRKSERYFKTDMLYAVTNGFWLSMGQGLSIVAVFAFAVVFGYFLPKQVYGDYKFILSVVSILGSLSLAGMGTVVVQATAQGKEGVLKDAVRTALRWGFLVWVVGAFLAAYYYFEGNPSLTWAILIAALCTPLMNAYSLGLSLFSGRRDFKRSTMYAAFVQLVTTMALIATAVYVHDALVLVAVNFLINTSLNFAVYIYILAKWRPNDVSDPEMIKYGKHISYMNFFGTLANQLDKVLVFHWLGAVELAVYAFAIAIPEQVKGSYKNLFNIALPKMSSADPKLLRASVMDKFYRLTVITVIAVLAYYFLAPYIYQLFFPKYLESVWYSQIYMLGLIAVPGIALFSSYFQVERDTATLYKLTVAGNIVTIFFSAVLIYFYGITGAVIENGVSWFAMLFINIYFFLRKR